MNPTIQIQTYSLYDFAVAVQDAVKQGYELSLENEHYPQQLGVLYVATLVKPAEEVPAEEQVAPKRKTKVA